VIAPDGAEVLLVAITAETRELTASKRRMLNQRIKLCELLLDEADRELSEHISNVQWEGQFYKSRHGKPRKLIIPAMYRSEVKATNFSENSAIIRAKG
jgi:hypothetical protein